MSSDLGERVAAETLELARLIVSELVTNSVRHTASPHVSITFVLRNELRIEVRDSGPSFNPAVAAPNGTPQGGWGLQIVERLSTRWGIENDETVCVWAEIPYLPATGS